MSREDIKAFRKQNRRKKIAGLGNQMSPTMMRRLNRFRVQSGFRELTEKERNCLKCDRNFRSTGPANRLCYYCGGSDHAPIDGGLFQDNGIHS